MYVNEQFEELTNKLAYPYFGKHLLFLQKEFRPHNIWIKCKITLWCVLLSMCQVINYIYVSLQYTTIYARVTYLRLSRMLEHQTVNMNTTNRGI